MGKALGVAGLVGEQAAGQNPVREVVHPAPALPAHADHLAHVQQPLDCDLGIRPVPPGAPVLGPTELGGRERAFGPQPGQDLGAGAPVALMPALAAGTQGAPAERIVGPFLDRQHAGGVRPVLEGGRPARVPVRPLDPLPRDGAEPGVGHELVRAGKHADGVELHRAEPAQHRGHPAAPALSADKPLRPQRHEPDIVGGQGQFRCLDGKGGHEYTSLAVAYDISAAPLARPGPGRDAERRGS
jgi:hypothetical protein